MTTLRRILIGLAVLFAAGGLAVLLLPFDAELPVPSIAGEVGLDVEVPCKAPLVDLVTGEPSDQWLNYAPGEGVSYGSSGRAGGSMCSPESSQRGFAGVGLIVAAFVAIGAAVVVGRRAGRTDTDDDAPPADAEQAADGAQRT
jgi:hypothetical protein